MGRVYEVSGAWVHVMFPSTGFVFPADNGHSDRAAWVLRSSVDIPPTSVTVTPASLTVQQGKAAALSAVVTGVGPGSAVVKVAGVSLDRSSLSVPVGSSSTLKASVSPADASDKKVTWSSGNTKVATVSSSGVVTGKAAGKVTVTVKTADGAKTAKATVAVKAKPASTLTLIDGTKVPSFLKSGTAVSVTGMVKSNYKLTKVTAVIKTGGGTAKYNVSTNPGATSFNLKTWDNRLLFSKLAAGSYIYMVTAIDASGASKTFQSVPFKVVAAATPAVS
ncbi:MAG: Ig-like domain-containing protein, partial [Propionibacteriaceae bacterium]|nr:Ig-like domain-containing protein [Propionibacteriaceae bacterium]